MKKLAIITTHPIQYNAPWFKLLTQRGRLKINVFYTWSQSQSGPKYDPDFKRKIEWDLPLLDGYEYVFIENVATNPGSHHFSGIDNPSLITAVKDWAPDAILVFGWSFKSHLRCLRYFKNKIPVLFRGDSTLLDEKPGIKKVLRRFFLRWVYRHIDIALYTGTHNKAYFLAHGLNAKQLLPAYHAVDNERFSMNDVKQAAALQLRKDWEIAPNAFVILFAGKFEEKKNPLFLLELARRLPDREFVFLLVGNGQLENELKAKAKDDSRVRFIPFQNQTQMPVVYGLANVFVLPSKGPNETWGLAANEAMASGLPVILSAKAGGAIDLVRGNGVMIDPDNVEEAVNFLQGVKNDERLYRQYREASLSAIKQFSYEQLAAAVEAACDL